MRDRLSKEWRSWNMSRIRGKDTTPEKVVRSLLQRMGYRSKNVNALVSRRKAKFQVFRWLLTVSADSGSRRRQ